ncbi:hypothetical protein CK498_18535 [Halomonas salipaludis]|uniref:Uncharacterized protein n=2 Tax=Halomonas salipaludis TaxID=2032625 RepID=A0A2A2ERZ3_9GAMM|nr:hypothetical protein CK498_18535 [Halomonas salipaludis]
MEGTAMSAPLAIEQDVSRQWQQALDRALAAHEQESATAYYTYIALAFPADTPYTSNANPLIDFRSLKRWARERGWRVLPSRQASPSDKYRPPVRFMRHASPLH